MSPTRIHHINFVVHDLEQAIHAYESRLGLPAFEVFDHTLRGSRIATSMIGETTFVLVCPYDIDSVPGRYLQEHGEGFFMLSFGMNDLADAARNLEGAGPMRDGLGDWRVADIGTWFGADLQLTDD